MKHSRFYSLLAQMPGADKETIVGQASGFTTSLSEFANADIAGYWRMIADMERAVGVAKDVPHFKNVEHLEKEQKRLRSAILHRLQMHGIDTTNWKRVNEFMQKPRIAGKLMYEMTIDEMKAFIPKMEAILANDKKQMEKEKQKVLNN